MKEFTKNFTLMTLCLLLVTALILPAAATDVPNVEAQLQQFPSDWSNEFALPPNGENFAFLTSTFSDAHDELYDSYFQSIQQEHQKQFEETEKSIENTRAFIDIFHVVFGILFVGTLILSILVIRKSIRINRLLETARGNPCEETTTALLRQMRTVSGLLRFVLTNKHTISYDLIRDVFNLHINRSDAVSTITKQALRTQLNAWNVYGLEPVLDFE